MTFTAKIGFFDALLHHVGERDGSHFYLATETDAERIAALQSGRLSVRGALSGDKYWVIEANRNLVVERFWGCSADNVPASLMPPSHVPLYPYLPSCPDYMEQSSAYFSMAFKGEKIGNRSMPFGLLRTLINGAYDATRRILSPAEFLGSKSSTFDLPAYQPEFGSLVLALGAPLVTHKALKKRSLSEITAREQFDARRESFFSEMAELVSDAQTGAISDSVAEHRFALLDNIHRILPSQDSSLNEVTFAGVSDSSLRTLTVDEKAGVRINQAFKRAEGRVITEVGQVEIVNTNTKNFVYMSQRGKMVRCDLLSGHFDELIASGGLVNKAKVRVRGRLTRRTNRDQLTAEERPQILERTLFDVFD